MSLTRACKEKDEEDEEDEEDIEKGANTPWGSGLQA
jgi:hypothetical protein